MSAPDRPDGKPAGSPASADTGKRNTVGVYDRPAAADRPSMLPKIITAVIVVLMLVLTWLFWPRSAGASTHVPPQPIACSQQGLQPSAAARQPQQPDTVGAQRTEADGPSTDAQSPQTARLASRAL